MKNEFLNNKENTGTAQAADASAVSAERNGTENKPQNPVPFPIQNRQPAPVYFNGTYAAAFPQKPKPKFELSGREYAFAALSALLCIFAVSLTLWGGFKAGFTASFVLLFAAATAFCFKRSQKFTPFGFVCGALALISSAVFAVTENFTVNICLLAVMFFLSAVWFDSLTGASEENGDLGLIKNAFCTSFGTAFSNLGISMRSVFSAEDRKKKIVGRAVVGAVSAIPVLFIVIPLLISSDEAFEGLFNRIFSDAFEMLLKIIIGLIVFPLFFSFCLGLKKGKKKTALKGKFGGIDNAYIIAFLAVISVCYIAYLFSQLAYFFSAFSGILPEGYNFVVSQYARRGFFEISVIAAVNFVLIFGGLLLSKKKNSKPSPAIIALCMFIGLFTLLLTATAVSKMVLYIRSFGMTVLRIGTGAFMIFLAVVFVSLMLRCFLPKIRVLRTGLIAAALILLVLGFGNINGFVAKYNYTAYKNGSLPEIDVETIYRMGDAGVPYLISLASDENKKVSEDAEEWLECRFEELYDTCRENGNKTYKKTKDSLKGWNLTRERAYGSFDEYIEKNPEFLDKVLN